MSLIDAAIIIEAQAKLIKEQTLEIIALEQKLEQREYNRRFANKPKRFRRSDGWYHSTYKPEPKDTQGALKK